MRVLLLHYGHAPAEVRREKRVSDSLELEVIDGLGGGGTASTQARRRFRSVQLSGRCWFKLRESDPK